MKNDSDADWCDVFGELLVFKQDFDTAMHILMFQDEKVARLSLEASPLKTIKRGKRTITRRNCPSIRQSPSKKRRRSEISQIKRGEDPRLSLRVITYFSSEGDDEKEEKRGIKVTQDIETKNDVVVEDFATLLGDCSDSTAMVPSLCSSGSGKTMSVSKSRLQVYDEKLNSMEESMADSTAMVPSLFSTGSGKTMSVSKSRLQAYEEKLNSMEESMADSTAVVPSLFSSGSGKTMSVSKSRLQVYEKKLNSMEESMANSTAMVPSLFSSGSGKTMSVSKSRLQVYEKKLNSMEETMDDSTAMVPSLFSTGSGKTMSVSKSRLQAYDEKLNSMEESMANSTAMVPSLFSSGSGKTMSVSKSRLQVYEKKLNSMEETMADSTAMVPSLFSTGSGKTMSVSKSRLQVYDEKLNSMEESMADSTAMVPSLFSTGSGKTMSVSKSRLQAYEEKLNSMEEAMADSTAMVPSLFSTGSGKTMSVSKSRLQAYEEKLNSMEESMADNTAMVPSLFSTGSGKTMSVSKSRLQAYEEKLNSMEEAMADSTAMVPSLFSTGSGKTMSVSKSRLRVYEEKLNSMEEVMLLSSMDPVNLSARNARYNASGLGGTKNGAEGTRLGNVGIIGLTMRNQSKMLGGSRERLMPFCAVADDPALVGCSRGSALPPDRSRESVYHQVESHSRGRGLDCSDKENVHPESLRDRETAAVETSKMWRPRFSLKKPILRSVSKYREHQSIQHQGMAKRVLKPSIEPRAKLIGKRQFHPPLPSKRLCANDFEGLRELGSHPTGLRSNTKKAIAVEAQPFVYQETMKISLASLMRLYEDRSRVEKGFELDRREVLNCITAENAVNVCFSRDGNLMCSSEASYDMALFTGPRELYRQLKVRKHIVKTMGATFAWFLNHYRWIVWKLAAMERSFPHLLLKKYLTKDQVLKQITYRHQRDLNDAQRSILKKVLNRDASSLNCMVLCVAAVLPFPAKTNSPFDEELPACWNLALVLTDGWYSVYAVPDAPLAAVLWKLNAKSSIVGTKLATWNASLQNSVEGIDPLECAIVCESQWKNPLLAKEDLAKWPYLHLRYNSTRRVRFETRLGVEELRYVIPPILRQRKKQQPQLTFALLKSIPLKSLEIGGGMVRSVRIRVTRVSPLLHIQAKEWTLGPRVLCGEHLPLYFELRSEYGRTAMQEKHRQNGLDSPVDDWSGDGLIDVPPPTPYIKVDVECTHNSANDDLGSGCGILTIWRPSEELLSGGIKEGCEYFVSSLTVNWKLDGGRGHDAFLQLSSTKHSSFEKVHDEKNSSDDESKNAAQLNQGQRVCLDVQQATLNYRSNFEEGLNGRRNERRPTIDVCVCVVLVAAREMQDVSTPSDKRQAEVSLLDPAIKPKESRYVEHVFVTDQSCHLMSIRISGVNVSMPKKTSNGPLNRASSSSFDFCRGSRSIWKEGTVLCLSGLEVSHYDEQLRILDCVLVESTQIVSFPSKNSPFWNHFNLLQREAGIFATRGFSAHALPSVSDFTTAFMQLKKYVERDILRMDYFPSQECNESHVEKIDQKQLTQDIQVQKEGGGDATDTKRDDKAPSTLCRQLTWEASVIKIMPLIGASKLAFPSDVIAFACVNIRIDDDAFRMLYLTREAMVSMQTLLKPAEHCRGTNGTDSDLVQTVTELLSKVKLGNTAIIFRFEVRQTTNERLINSWKPWERLHASYWIAEKVTATPSRTLR
ncbi:hypothetical protein DD237_001468 [Peronospora effusa]|uniref:Tower domain-containing protein n=1 Tax=Peronospora effusa TaxID=542832 RepID=A0A3R7XKN6_9STRA|nr:hypothetical protein DD237_001468 [Peronospora effusa]